jgi:hypothetical protein
MRFSSGAFHHGQHGAALLAFMLILIVTAASMLMSRLNEHAQTYARDMRTQIALDQAKRALLQYAMNYPELRNDSEKGPGFLPCPFVNDDTETPTEIDDIGLPESNCSVGAGTTIGRLPFRILGLTDLRDSSGEYLWYAVSDNFKNVQTGNPVINSDTPGLLNVDGQGDVVAVVIAPGVAYGGQSGRTQDAKAAGFATLANYLEGTNATGAAVNFSSTAAGEFNDRIVTITRAELMEVIEKRVVSEARALLIAYADAIALFEDDSIPATYDGAYPWLAPFADPKSSFNPVRGSHTASSNSTSLTDSSQDFTEWGIQPGDLVRNITDGSVATVSSVAATTLTLGTLLHGTDNDFDRGDAYVVNVSQLGARLRSIATAGSSGTTLADSARDFVELGVTSGDVIDNVTSGSSAVVQTVSTNQITVQSGGATFASGDAYAIRSNYGQATGGSSTTLVDTNKNFATMGLQAGDLVVNVTDGSIARVASVSSATTLTMSEIYLGTENDFDIGDYYYIPRFNTDSATREGLLSIHERGEHFRTGFDLDWNLLQSDGILIATTPSPAGAAAHADYVTRTRLDAETSGSTYSFSSDEAACVWMNEDFVECSGWKQVDPVAVGGLVTSGTNTSTVTDSTQTFMTKRVKIGDIVQNFNDETDLFTRTTDAGSSGSTLYDVGANFTTYNTAGPYELLVRNNVTGVQGVVTEIVDDNTLIAEGYPGSSAIAFSAGQSYTLRRPQYMVVSAAPASESTLTTKSLSGTAPDFDSGEYYRIVSAANTISDTLDAVSGSTWMRDLDHDFGAEGVEIGDIVEAGNTADRSFGIITGVSGNWINATLYSGSSNTFFTSPYTYKIYHGYVSRRELKFQVRFRGGTAAPLGKNVYSVAGVRKRSACIGYGTDCSAIAAGGSVPYNFGNPVITITDYEDDGNIAATTTSTIPNTGSPTGNVRVAGIDYGLAEDDGEVPDWFIRNKWHQYVYVAFSSGFQPGGAGTCTAGTDCLQLSTPYAGTQNDRHSVVMTVGSELASQNRAVSGVTEWEYLEAIPRGSHTGSSNSSNLTDSSQDFTAWGVAPGAIARNVTDGSTATVSAVAATTLTLNTLTGGVENDFDTGDRYLIHDDLFERNLLTGSFNDQVTAVCPDPLNVICP